MESFPLTRDATHRLIVPALKAITVLGLVRASLGLLALPWVEWRFDLIDDVWLMGWFSICAVALFRTRQQFAACCALLAAAYADPALGAAHLDASWFAVQVFFVPVLWLIAIEQPVPMPSGSGRRAAEGLCLAAFAVAFATLTGILPSELDWLVLSSIGAPAVVLLFYRVKKHEHQFSLSDAYVCLGVAAPTLYLVLEVLSVVFLGHSVLVPWVGLQIVVNLCLSITPLGALVETYGSGRA